MFCRKCGAQLNNDEKFCYQCGAPVSGRKNETAAVKKQKKLWPFVLVIVLILLVLIGLLVYMFAFGSTEKKFNDQLELAERYLDELDYRKAIAAYKEAIEIDPNREEAYLGLAEAYVEAGDIDAAIRVLEEGYDACGSKKIERKLKELREKVKEEETEEVAEVVEEKIMEQMALKDVPDIEKLEAFLGKFGWYVMQSDYDCNKVYDYTASTMLDHILASRECCIDYDAYPLKDVLLYHDSSVQQDPLKKFYRDGYWTYDEKSIDWILYKIFNYSEQSVTEIKEYWSDTNYAYLYGGCYYFNNRDIDDVMTYGITGSGFSCRVDSVWFDGEQYKVNYQLTPSADNYHYDTDYQMPLQEAEMIYKEIDGSCYWTILSNQDNIEQYAKALADEREELDWKKIYIDFLHEMEQFSYCSVGLVYFDDDDIPELFFTMGPGSDYNSLYYIRGNKVRGIFAAPEIWVAERQSVIVHTIWQQDTVNSLSECRSYSVQDDSGEPGGVDKVCKWDGRKWAYWSEDHGSAALETLAWNYTHLTSDNFDTGYKVNGKTATYAEFLAYAESFKPVRLYNIAMSYDELLAYLME